MGTFRQFLGHDCADGNLTSMQAFGDDKKKARPVSTEEGYQKWIDQHDGKIQVYVSINPIKKGSRKFPRDVDVSYWCNEYIDLDCEKPKKCKGYNATDAELEKLEPFVGKINKWLTDNGFKTGYNDFTGNGYRWILPIPPLKLDGVDLAELAAKKKEFKERLVKGVGITPGCGAAIDSVFDFKRITGVPGTQNMKVVVEGRPGRSRKPFTGAVRDEDQNLRDYIMLIKIEHAAPTPAAAQRPSPGNVEAIAKKDAKLKRLLAGDSSGYPSPSEADLALANKLVFYNFSEEEIADALLSVPGGDATKKADAGNKQYTTRTVAKAFEYTQDRATVPMHTEEVRKAAQPVPGQYEVVNFELFRKLVTQYPQARVAAVKHEGVDAVYEITGDDFIKVALGVDAITQHTSDDGRAIVITCPELLRDFIQGVEVRKDADDTVYFLTIRGKKLEFGIKELTDVPTWRNKIIQCNLVISFDIKAHALRDTWSRLIAEILDRAKVEWEEEMSGNDLYASLVVTEVQKLVEAADRKAFKLNPVSFLKEDGAILVKTDTIREIVERKKIPYDLAKLRRVLSEHLVRSTKQIRIQKSLISVWFFKDSGALDDE